MHGLHLGFVFPSPLIRPGWKASDTLMLCRWLVRVVRNGALLPDGSGRSGVSLVAADPERGPIVRAIEDSCCSLLRFFQVIYKGGLWLSKAEAKSAIDSINLFCAAYVFLAKTYHQQDACLFHLEPALHMCKHMALRLQSTLSPLLASCATSPKTMWVMWQD